MALSSEINQYLVSVLHPEAYEDFCPNGLQVQGKEEVSCLVSGVTANQALIDKAIEYGADVIVVHHGFFWKNEPREITGIQYQRLRKLITHDVNLFAYHLPLDGNQIWGNNVQFAKQLSLPVIGPVCSKDRNALMLYGEYNAPVHLADLEKLISQQLKRTPLCLSGPGRPIKKIAWCTGAGQSFFREAIDAGMDCFITGEVSEYCVSLAREYNVNFIAVGHHASERYGVKALGDHLAEAFNLKHQFIDIDSPV